MPLTLDQLKERLKQPSKKAIISQAQTHENRIRFHSEGAIHREFVSPYYNDYLSWVSARLPKDKFDEFRSLLKFPVKTVKETQKIYEELAKVYDGQNPVYQYDFAAPELNDDWKQYITEELELPNFWRTKSIEAMKTMINSIVVVDMPSEQISERPKPYVYFVSISSVIDFSASPDELDFLIYRIDDKTIAVIDDTAYRTYYYENDPRKLTLLTEAPHDLGYCPARFFWTEKVSESTPDIRKSPTSNHLGDLDWLLFFMIAKQSLDFFAGYPIYSAYEFDCTYESEMGGEFVRCDGGFLRNVNMQYITHADGSLSKCPVCRDKRAGGPGTYYEIPQPGPHNDNADMRNPVSILTIDKKALDYNVAEEERLKRVIMHDICGAAHEPANDQAMNVKQIMAAFEGKTSVLRSIKKNFEQVMEFVEYTIAKLRYGNLFMGCYINLGTDFYLYESQYLLDLYHTARKAEAEQSVLDALQYQYLSTRYRNSPDQLKREMILCHLDPMRHVSVQKAHEMHKDNLIGYSDFVVKLKFSTFVMRFEREEAPITEWGSALPYDERIKKMQSIIYSYVTRPDSKEGFHPPETGESGPTGGSGNGKPSGGSGGGSGTDGDD